MKKIISLMVLNIVLISQVFGGGCRSEAEKKAEKLKRIEAVKEINRMTGNYEDSLDLTSAGGAINFNMVPVSEANSTDSTASTDDYDDNDM